MKIIYNVTVLIDIEADDEWKSWMIENHIPEVMDTGCFESWKVSRILGADESQGINYAVQYISPSFEKFQEYRDNHASRLQKEHNILFKERYVAFRTLMETISEGINRNSDI